MYTRGLGGTPYVHPVVWETCWVCTPCGMGDMLGMYTLVYTP